MISENFFLVRRQTKKIILQSSINPRKIKKNQNRWTFSVNEYWYNWCITFIMVWIQISIRISDLVLYQLIIAKLFRQSSIGVLFHIQLIINACSIFNFYCNKIKIIKMFLAPYIFFTYFIYWLGFNREMNARLCACTPTKWIKKTQYNDIQQNFNYSFKIFKTLAID